MKRGRHVYRPKRAFAVALELGQELEKKPKQRKRGRPPTYPEHLYLALLVLRSYFNRTYRKQRPSSAIFSQEGHARAAKLSTGI